ncbi:MAG: glycosyltransferase family 2 protein, partial [Sphingobacteriales bacterium]
STDNSEELAKSWAQKDNRFKYFTITNAGVSHARNFGINHSTGHYVLPLDGDDRISLNFLEEAVNAMQSGDFDLAYGINMQFGAETGEWAAGDYDYKKLLHQNLFPCTALYRRSDYDKTPGYSEAMREGLEDWEFWLHLLDEKSKVVRIKNITFYYRRKPASRSAEISKALEVKLRRQIVKNHQDLYDRHLPDLITLYHDHSFLERSVFLFLARHFKRKLLGK